MVNKILKPHERGLAEEHDAQSVIYHIPQGFSDRFALGFTKLPRFSADTFFAKPTTAHRVSAISTRKQ